MSSSQTLKINCDRCDNAFVVNFFKTMYNKTIIRFGFCDIRNNQGRGKRYQPKPKADITKTSSNNCLLLFHYDVILPYLDKRTRKYETVIHCSVPV